MPSLNPIATELTTAATDLVLTLIALAIIAVLYRVGRRRDPTKTRIWIGAMACLAVGGVVGAAFHGLALDLDGRKLLWIPLTLCASLAVSLFFVGAFYDARGFSMPAWLPAAAVAAGIAFALTVVIFSGAFFALLIYEAAAMLYALGSYSRLAFKGGMAGAGLMAAGVLVSIAAAVVQAVGEVTGAFRFTLVWAFDHNGTFHFVQMAGLALLLAGLWRSLAARA